MHRGLFAGYYRKILSYNPIAYWPMWEASGTVAVDASGNGRNGAYTGVTLGQPGIGDGKTCPFFDGVSDYNNVYSVSFRDSFNGAGGTVIAWAKLINVDYWTNPSTRRVLNFEADTSNYVIMQKVGVNLQWFYTAGGTSKTVIVAGSGASWMTLGLTWSKSAGATGQMLAFRNGAQVGSTQTGLGTWAGLLAATTTNVGARTTVPSAVWYNVLAHCAVWDRVLTPTQMADLAVI